MPSPDGGSSLAVRASTLRRAERACSRSRATRPAPARGGPPLPYTAPVASRRAVLARVTPPPSSRSFLAGYPQAGPRNPVLTRTGGRLPDGQLDEHAAVQPHRAQVVLLGHDREPALLVETDRRLARVAPDELGVARREPGQPLCDERAAGAEPPHPRIRGHPAQLPGALGVPPRAVPGVEPDDAHDLTAVDPRREVQRVRGVVLLDLHGTALAELLRPQRIGGRGVDLLDGDRAGQRLRTHPSSVPQRARRPRRVLR